MKNICVLYKKGTASVQTRVQWEKFQYFSPDFLAKGQIKPKADLHTIDSPKTNRQKNVRVCFLPWRVIKQRKQIRLFAFSENLRLANLFLVLSDL